MKELKEIKVPSKVVGTRDGKTFQVKVNFSEAYQEFHIHMNCNGKNKGEVAVRIDRILAVIDRIIKDFINLHCKVMVEAETLYRTDEYGYFIEI